MKIVILASGKGIRMRPLTNKVPKPLLKVNGKPIIHYIFEATNSVADEAIVVVKYRGQQIKDYLGESYLGVKITYVEGSDKGNAYSFLNTQGLLDNERFMVIYGDEIPNHKNIKRCLDEKLSVLTYKFGIKDGVMVLNTDIFNYEPIENNGEYQFSDLVDEFIKHHKVIYVEAENFIGELNTPKDILRVERKLKRAKN